MNSWKSQHYFFFSFTVIFKWNKNKRINCRYNDWTRTSPAWNKLTLDPEVWCFNIDKWQMIEICEPRLLKIPFCRCLLMSVYCSYSNGAAFFPHCCPVCFYAQRRVWSRVIIGHVFTSFWFYKLGRLYEFACRCSNVVCASGGRSVCMLVCDAVKVDAF